MKKCLRKQMFISALLALLLIPTNAVGEDTTKSSPIKIDRHWIYILQLDDLKTFEINEYFYINNTGETAFNDTFYIWIQNNSIISADSCNYTTNMACRYKETRDGECFYLNKTDEDNIYIGYPFLNENKLSYYGQRETFSITAFSITNTSLKNDTLNLNATIGVPSISREQKNFQDIGVHLTSENLNVWMLPVIDLYMPFNITTIENITLFNNGTDTEVIGFSISDLPGGWTAEIWNDTKRLDNVSLSSQEYVNLTLIVKAPSYLASIYVGYISQMGINGDQTKGSFIKRYLYETTKITYEVFLLNKDGVEVSNDLIMIHDELYWIENYGRYWFYAKNEEVQPNSYTTMSMKLEKNTDGKSNIYIILILVFIVILIVVILLLKWLDFFKEKKTLQNQDVSKEKGKFTEEKRIKDLEEQKEKVVSAIKRVENEFKDGIISKEDYEQVRASYKKRAVEILKEIDKLREIEDK